MRFFKSSFSYLFFISLFFAFIGSSECLRTIRQEIQKEIKEKITKNFYQEKELVEFSYTQASAFKWYSDSEFQFEGKFYDIIKIKKDKKKMLCLKDSKETRLRQMERTAQSFFFFKMQNYPQFIPYSKDIKLNIQKNLVFYNCSADSDDLFVKHSYSPRIKNFNFRFSIEKGFLNDNFPPPEKVIFI